MRRMEEGHEAEKENTRWNMEVLVAEKEVLVAEKEVMRRTIIQTEQRLSVEVATIAAYHVSEAGYNYFPIYMQYIMEVGLFELVTELGFFIVVIEPGFFVLLIEPLFLYSSWSQLFCSRYGAMDFCT
jgi:hypothetical protein